jgi:hypothetical protein
MRHPGPGRPMSVSILELVEIPLLGAINISTSPRVLTRTQFSFLSDQR